MIRRDEEAAGIAYVVPGPNGPLYADFHCLRHTFIALLDRSGATLKEAMQPAQHSDPKLTMAVYGPAQLIDLGETVARLPSVCGFASHSGGSISDALPDALAGDGGCGPLSGLRWKAAAASKVGRIVTG